MKVWTWWNCGILVGWNWKYLLTIFALWSTKLFWAQANVVWKTSASVFADWVTYGCVKQQQKMTKNQKLSRGLMNDNKVQSYIITLTIANFLNRSVLWLLKLYPISRVADQLNFLNTTGEGETCAAGRYACRRIANNTWILRSWGFFDARFTFRELTLWAFEDFRTDTNIWCLTETQILARRCTNSCWVGKKKSINQFQKTFMKENYCFHLWGVQIWLELAWLVLFLMQPS